LGVDERSSVGDSILDLQAIPSRRHRLRTGTDEAVSPCPSLHRWIPHSFFRASACLSLRLTLGPRHFDSSRGDPLCDQQSLVRPRRSAPCSATSRRLGPLRAMRTIYDSPSSSSRITSIRGARPEAQLVSNEGIPRRHHHQPTAGAGSRALASRWIRCLQ
jgi:hypothetical protein